MGDANQLFETADRQQGFFTAKQVEVCGYSRSNFCLRLASVEWTQLDLVPTSGVCLRETPCAENRSNDDL